MLNKSIPKFKNKHERIEYWRTIYKARLTSNLTNVKFSAQHNISEAALYRWVRYFEKHQGNSKQLTKNNKCKHNATFMPVTVSDVSHNQLVMPTETSSYIELLLPNGVKLIFKQAVNMNLLMQLITARY